MKNQSSFSLLLLCLLGQSCQEDIKLREKFGIQYYYIGRDGNSDVYYLEGDIYSIAEQKERELLKFSYCVSFIRGESDRPKNIYFTQKYSENIEEYSMEKKETMVTVGFEVKNNQFYPYIRSIKDKNGHLRIFTPNTNFNNGERLEAIRCWP